MRYREYALGEGLTALAECGWERPGPSGPGRILPDGCMDLIRDGDRIVVAGPDTVAFDTPGSPDLVQGIRFRPGMLPRLLGVPAAELRDRRTDLRELTAIRRDRCLTDVAVTLAAAPPRAETAPWTLPDLRRLTRHLAGGGSVAAAARDSGWSSRTLQRHCLAVYGYGPATLRRVLRFRRAAGMLRAGLAPAVVAADAGYADQPHLHREVRALSGAPLSQVVGYLTSTANRSTDVPSGSVTVA
jgi:AraC-like DNA-binding protein